MKIALIGYGKMGKLIDSVACKRGHQIVARLQSTHLNWEGVSEADLCIEFTAPERALTHIRRCAELKKNVVVGTTGWYDQLDEVKELSQHIAILYAPNFSLGVFLWLKMVRYSAQLMSAFAQFQASGKECHHKEKRDMPSGTSQLMAAIVEKEIPQKIEIESIREEGEVGSHLLHYDSPVDRITIGHVSKSREGFAEGALIAAEWLEGKKGLFTLEDMWKDALQH